MMGACIISIRPAEPSPDHQAASSSLPGQKPRKAVMRRGASGSDRRLSLPQFAQTTASQLADDTAGTRIARLITQRLASKWRPRG
jgi:hypothetical protein